MTSRQGYMDDSETDTATDAGTEPDTLMDTRRTQQMDTQRSTYKDDDNNPMAYSQLSTVPIRGGMTRLPPLQGRTQGQLDDQAPPSSRPLPPLKRGIGDHLLDTKGSVPSHIAQDTVISVPEAGDHPAGVNGRAGKPRQKVIDCVIYFQDKTGVHLKVEDGQHAEAGELFEMIMEEMNFPAEAREVFSLWLVSDFLELQLKPNHVPFKLVCYWEELLEKYTTAEEEDRERDEPVLMFQRNVFYPKKKEKKITDKELIRMLYHEAKENIIDGRYPLKLEQYDEMAGMQALLEVQGFDAATHTPEFYRPKLKEYYPDHLAKTKWSVIGISRSKESPEFRISREHDRSFRKFGRVDEKVSHSIHRAYLEACWKLPFYGSAFFRGQVEHVGGKFRIRALDDDPVYVAINTEGVYILDMDDVLFIMGLHFRQLSWEYAEPKDKDNPDTMPCFFLQFPAKEEGQEVTKLLQIFSKEAVLIDAMIEACVKLKEQEAGKPSKEKKLQEKEEAMMKATEEVWKRFSKMSLATFTKGGQLVNNKARVPKPN